MDEHQGDNTGPPGQLLQAELHTQEQEQQVGKRLQRFVGKLKSTPARKMQILHINLKKALLAARKKVLTTVNASLQDLNAQIAQAEQQAPALLASVPPEYHPLIMAVLGSLAGIRAQGIAACKRADRMARAIASLAENVIVQGNNQITLRQQYASLINLMNALGGIEDQLSRDVKHHGKAIDDIFNAVRKLETMVRDLASSHGDSLNEVAPLRGTVPGPLSDAAQRDDMDEDDEGVGEIPPLTEAQRLGTLDPGLTFSADGTVPGQNNPFGQLALGNMTSLLGQPTHILPSGHVYMQDPVTLAWMVRDTTHGVNYPYKKFFAVSTDTPRRDGQAVPPKQVSTRMPQPQKFSGDNPTDDLDESLFAFENYLRGTGTPRDQWPIVAMPLLTGSALRAYTNLAQPMALTGVTPSWEEFRSVLQPFARQDKQLTARQSLYSIKQTKSVAEYHQRFSLLVSRAGLPTPTDKDLLMLYWNGLTDVAKKSSPIDPITGLFWTSYSSLANHTLNIALSNSVSGFTRETDKRRWNHTDSKLRALKAKRNRTFGDGEGRGSGGGSPYAAGRGRGRGAAWTTVGGRHKKEKKEHRTTTDTGGGAGPSDPWCTNPKHSEGYLNSNNPHRVSQCKLSKD